MNDLIRNKLSLLPDKPGCYLMKDQEGTIIYVGKAKKLTNRVHSYFVGAHNYKTTKLVSEIVDFDYIVTDSEKEALLLEINLIKDYTPKYNIMFMDNSYYPYIMMTSETHPTLKIVRSASTKKDRYYGPFPDATAARETFKVLNQLFPLRKCKHIPNKPCLYYSLNQCLGPCINEVQPEQYDKIKGDISKFIKGNTKEIIEQLTNKMNLASEAFNYEQAIEYRDLINHIQYVTTKQHVQFNDHVDRDILGYHQDKGYLSIQLFFMRNGKLLSRDLNLSPIEDSLQESLEQFIVSFYQSNTLPNELLLPLDLDISVLSEILDTKVLQPQKGRKKDLVLMANNNAKESLEKKFALEEKNYKKTMGAIIELGNLLQIDTPHVIELFDNSHIQGSYAVAGMVCYKDGVPSKKDYRKFNIKLSEGNDDYASMREVIYRRYYRLLVESKAMPDMIIVDGGIGQIHAAREILDSLNLPIKLCGLAKDDKHSTAILLDREGNRIPIDSKSDLFFLLTRMQDEVHRYAISFHQNQRSKSLTSSILDEIEGVGPKRKKELMKVFKSLKKMKEATLEELEKVVPTKVAHEVYDRLHDD